MVQCCKQEMKILKSGKALCNVCGFSVTDPFIRQESKEKFPNRAPQLANNCEHNYGSYIGKDRKTYCVGCGIEMEG